jgi:hypothetical protein
MYSFFLDYMGRIKTKNISRYCPFNKAYSFKGKVQLKDQSYIGFTPNIRDCAKKCMGSFLIFP